MPTLGNSRASAVLLSRTRFLGDGQRGTALGEDCRSEEVRAMESEALSTLVDEHRDIGGPAVAGVTICAAVVTAVASFAALVAWL